MRRSSRQHVKMMQLAAGYVTDSSQKALENTAGFWFQYLVRHSHDFTCHFIQLVLFSLAPA